MLVAAGIDIAGIEIACDAVDPERAQHFLRWRWDAGGREGELLAQDLFMTMLQGGLPTLRLDADGEAFARVRRSGATDALAFASHLEPDATLGFFDDVMTLFVTGRRGGFRPAEIDLLHRVTPVFALALGARLNADAARVLLRTYLGQGAATALLDGRVHLGEVETIRAVVIYCDLAGFTALTELLDAATLVAMLNLFFETVTRPVARAGGQVSGHVGDAVVMYFPIPDGESERAVCAGAVKAGLEGLEALASPSAAGFRGPAAPLHARVGIDLGPVVHGNIGSAGRFSFTIIGTPVNRAARLQALAKDLGAVVLTTAALAEAAGVRWRGVGRHRLRGLEKARRPRWRCQNLRRIAQRHRRASSRATVPAEIFLFFQLPGGVVVARRGNANG